MVGAVAGDLHVLGHGQHVAAPLVDHGVAAVGTQTSFTVPPKWTFSVSSILGMSQQSAMSIQLSGSSTCWPSTIFCLKMPSS